MRLYNTLSRSEETFAPVVGNTVRLYSCGLTVYARGHIGNFRTFVCVDVLRRTLRHLLGYDVHHVMNFTDVDDRTIIGAQAAHMDLRSYTDQFIAAFREDARAIGLEEVEDMPRATDEANLKAMADLVHALDKRGHTYRSDGSVYFKISTLPEYGRLARLDHEGIKPGARIVANTFTMEDWAADQTETVTGDCVSWCTALLWIVPAKVEGRWSVGAETLTLTQQFQVISGTLGTAAISAGKMNGENITFAAGGATYTGRVSGNTMQGTRTGGGSWRATRQ